MRSARKVLGRRIRELRGDVSTRELSKQVGIARTSLIFYEAGKGNPNVMSIMKLADYFDVSVDYLLGRDD